MLDVIKKIEVLYNTLKLRLDHYNAGLAKLNADQAELTEKLAVAKGGEDNLRNLERLVRSREAKVKNIEDLLVLEQKVAADRGALAREQEAFNKESKATQKKITDDQNSLAIRTKKVNEQALALDKSKKDYKEKLRDELLGEIARKK